MKDYRFKTMLFIASFLLCGCKPSNEDRARWAENRRIHCLDMPCQGDLIPKPAPGLDVIKVNGVWYLVPKDYRFGSSGLVFSWPDKIPVAANFSKKQPPEPRVAEPDAAIEIFLLRARGIARNNSFYSELMEADRNGKILGKWKFGKDLEVWRTLQEGTAREIDWYIAARQRDAEQQPPVLWCEHGRSDVQACTWGQKWRHGSNVYVRFNAKHAKDWPDIYSEVMRVLAMVSDA